MMIWYDWQPAHKQSRDLLTALKDHGWKGVAAPFPGSLEFAHPRSGEDMPTPEYMRGSPAWPFDTYYKIRNLSINYDLTWDRITFVARREGVPWIGTTTVQVSFKKAIEYVSEDWAPE